MDLEVVVHRTEEGGYWAEVPAIPGCVTQAETVEDLRANVREAAEGCLSVDALGAVEISEVPPASRPTTKRRG